jgi:hypothetical protein
VIQVTKVAPLERLRQLLFANFGLKLLAIVVSLVVYGVAHRPKPVPVPPPEPAAEGQVCAPPGP